MHENLSSFLKTKGKEGNSSGQKKQKEGGQKQNGGESIEERIKALDTGVLQAVWEDAKVRQIALLSLLSIIPLFLATYICFLSNKM